VGESRTAAAVIAQACYCEGTGETWTWYDRRLPTLAQVLTALCAPWDVIPRLVSSKLIERAGYVIAPSIGMPRALLAYAKHWVQLDRAVLDDLPLGLPECPAGYCEATGDMFRRSSLAMAA
jgi:hypothetical protein